MRKQDQTRRKATDITFVSSLYLPQPRALVAIACAAGLVASAIMLAPGMIASSAILALALSWASLVDIDRHLLPDAITLGLAVVGLAIALAGPADALLARAIGAAAGYGAPAGIAWLYRRIRGRDGLGLGDAKLLAASGAWLGWTSLPFVLLFAASVGLAFVAISSVVSGRALTQRIAFGPFIAGGFWTCWLAAQSGAFRFVIG